ncbi:MAG: protein kinase [Chloroflexi bacterium]|nr:protein kinase [Chloroflexota bacterium]
MNPNDRIGHYRIQRLLGHGAMASVYQALDEQLQRTVALKVMNQDVARNAELRERFMQEARSAAGLSHPNIVQVYTFHAEENQLYLAMAYIQGGSLRDYLRNFSAQGRTMEIAEAVRIASQTAAALDYAHQQKVVHRDVKPVNILLKPPSVPTSGVRFDAMLTDFGLARALDQQAMIATDSTKLEGTFPYMAPELLEGYADPRVDVYALGIVLFEMLTGRLPATPHNIHEATAVAKEAPPSPRQFRNEIPETLERIILRAIAKAPESRYQDAREFGQALQKIPGAVASPKASSAQPAASYQATPSHQPAGQPSSGSSQDLIIVTREGQAPQTIQVNKSVIMVGRDVNHEIAIAGDRVSRNHARIERQPNGTYTVTDLGSTNGTFIESARLLQHVPEEWPPEQELIVGEFRLQLQKAKVQARSAQPNKTQVAGQDAGSSNEGEVYSTQQVGYVAGGTQIFDFDAVSSSSGSTTREQSTGQTASEGPADSGIDVIIEPERIEADAGAHVNIQVEVFNHSKIVKHCRIQILGLERKWVTVPPTSLQLLPDDSGQLPLIFHPPREASSYAGEHRFELRILDEKRKMIGQGFGVLVINPFYEFSLDLHPEVIQKRGLAWLTIHNDSNARDSYSVVGRDRENGLSFYLDQRPVIINPGAQHTLEVEVRPKSRVLLGQAKQYQFSLQTKAVSGAEKAKDGQLVSPALLPIWLLPLLMFLCVGILIAAILLLSSRGDEVAEETEEAPTSVVDTGPVADLLTATAENFEVVLQQQAVEADATATAQAGIDTDQDGLTDGEELALQADYPDLDPENPDSDGDGLSDGEEIALQEDFPDLDPTNPDTDGDGLEDGREIELRRDRYEDLDPTSRDTDDDDLSDGEEVNQHNTDPTDADSDGDTFEDGVEIEQGSDPNDFSSRPE